MTDRIDRELRQTINEVIDIHNDIRSRMDKNAEHGDLLAGLLTLATVTHQQNGALP